MTDDQAQESDTHAGDSDPFDDDATAMTGDTEPEETDSTGCRRWLVIIGMVLLLAAIGVALGMILPAGPPREADVAPAPLATAPSLLVAAEGNPEEVIATVGESKIYRRDFVRFYQPGSDPQESLDRLIQIELLLQAAVEEGVRVDETVLDEQLEQIKQEQANGDEAQFADFLRQHNIAGPDELRRLLARSQMIEQMILRHTNAEQVRARHILIATETLTDTAAVEAAQREAERLMAQLEQGADFAALAAAHSDDEVSRTNGGDLGWALRGMFVEPFDAAVFSMQPGERRLVQSQYGWHIVEVTEPPAVRPLASSDLLETSSGQQAFEETFIPYLEQLKAQAEQAQQIRILVPAERLVTQAGS